MDKRCVECGGARTDDGGIELNNGDYGCRDCLDRGLITERILSE